MVDEGLITDSFSELSDEMFDYGAEGQHGEVREADDDDGDACDQHRNRGVPVGKVPDVAGTLCLRPSEPAMARTGTIRANRPTSMQIACVVLYQSVLPLRPAKAEPLLLAGETKA